MPVLFLSILLGGEPTPQPEAVLLLPMDLVDEIDVPEEQLPSEDDSTAIIESIELDGQPIQLGEKKKFGHIFGPSKPEGESRTGSADDYVLQPFKPLSVIQTFTEPFREAHLLLPESWDPYSSPSPKWTAAAKEKDKQRMDKLDKQQKLLDLTLSGKIDSNWHFHAAAGGSFKQGNNPGSSANSQVSAEKRSVDSYFLARVSSFYNQLKGAKKNGRVFGELNFDHDLRGRWISYARQELEWDEARLINIRALTSVGIGFKFADTVKERLLLRMGPTGSYIDYASPDKGNDEGRVGWMTEVDYRRIIADTCRLQFTSTAFPDFNTQQTFRIRTEAATSSFPLVTTPVGTGKLVSVTNTS